MLSKSTGFARYSRTLCWIVAVIWAALAVLSFTGGGDNATLRGFLWLAGAAAFAVSATAMGKNAGSSQAAGEASD